MAIQRRKKKQLDTTLAEAFEEFAVEKDINNVSADTIRNYRQSFQKFCEQLELNPNETEIKNITARDISEWKHIMKGQEIRITSINHYLRDMRAFFNWAMLDERCYIDEPFRITMLKGQEELPKDFDENEINLLLKRPRKNDTYGQWRNWVITKWILATGNREATICNMQIDDLNFQKKEIILNRTKNKQVQVVPLSAELEKALKEYINMWGIEKWLFPATTGNKLTTNALRKSYTVYCKSRGVNHANLHGLRHSFAREWIKNNGDVFKLQQLLGHKTLEMTRHYVKIYGEDLKQDFNKYSPLDTLTRKSKRTREIKRKDE